MTTLAIDLNDAGLVVADAGGVLAVEPGYALVEGGTITTGTAAHAQARVKPREVGNRYWAGLSLEPGSAGVSGVSTAAELAFAQLRELWERCGGEASGADVVFAVPGHYSREQLGLLLGLAQECRMPVRALIDAAVAASARPYPGRQLVYVDAGLHRLSVTPVEQQGGEAVAQAEQGLESTGLADLADSLAGWFADVFVAATRFDPFRLAETEQQLYDALPEWLRVLREEPAAELSLRHGDEELRVTVEHEQLLGVFAGFNRALVQLIAQVRDPEAALVVQISERLRHVPGLAAQLARLDEARVVCFESGYTARAALAGIDALETGGAVRLIKHLAWRERPVQEEEEEDAPAALPEALQEAEAPTHVVYLGVAYPVAAGGLLVGRAALDGRRTIVVGGGHGGLSRSHCELVLRDGELKLRDLSRYGTFVNERRVAGEVVLKTRDVIRVGTPGAELQVIRVEGAHGA